jgi:hypothetical protein
MFEMAYAVHTRSCTYLLDEDGVCRSTLSPTGTVVPGSERCVGAQFVACLDLAVAGGLVGELRIGAAALFAQHEGGRFVLLRTPAIERVEVRPRERAVMAPPSPPARPLPQPRAPPRYPELSQFSREAREVAMEFADSRADGDEPVNVEELATYSEVTLTIPLYRPTSSESDAREPPRGKGIRPGRRLR